MRCEATGDGIRTLAFVDNDKFLTGSNGGNVKYWSINRLNTTSSNADEEDGESKNQKVQSEDPFLLLDNFETQNKSGLGIVNIKCFKTTNTSFVSTLY